jgi:hypothetical protein
MASRSEAWTVLARWNVGIMGSNPTRCMGVCMCLYSVCVAPGVGRCFATG